MRELTSSEGSENIQEDNKTLINASVLGLIFEKINGYKDGSYFTPGFITMKMCRDTIRRAVITKFNKNKGWDCKSISDVYNKIEDKNNANNIINSIKICDPAVGSGHFLVSSLNELISIKSELKILFDSEGKTLRDYNIEVINDELIITDENGFLFEYNPKSKESQRVQKSIFHEKENIIENCLFGVDINPNSVKICRLRLWIELLKNSYYKDGNQLETLPNIDINIKCGNSLIAKFELDINIKNELKKHKWDIESYQNAIMSYRNAYTKEHKKEMESLINTIKSDFEIDVKSNDKRIIRIDKLKREIDNLENQKELFEQTKKEINERKSLIEKKYQEMKNLEAEIKDISDNKAYENSFEWRFEFPEVLNENGEFLGFDIIIGNPPYIGEKDHSGLFSSYKILDKWKAILTKRTNLYYAFLIQSLSILQENGNICLIVPNELLTSDYAKHIRKSIISASSIIDIYDFNKNQVFKGVGTNAMIISYTNENIDECNYRIFENTSEENIDLFDLPYIENVISKTHLCNNDYWRLTEPVDEINSKSLLNLDYYGLTTQVGIQTGCNEAKGKLFNKIINKYPEYKKSEGLGIYVLEKNIDIKFENTGIYINNSVDNKKPTWKKLNKKEKEFIKPLCAGKEINKYYLNETTFYVIWLNKNNYSDKLMESIPNIREHLDNYKIFLINRNAKKFISIESGCRIN